VGWWWWWGGGIFQVQGVKITEGMKFHFLITTLTLIVLQIL